MKKISAFTEKFERITPPDDAVRRAVMRVVFDTLGIQLEMKDVRVHNAVAYITAEPAARSELFIKKKILLEALSSELGERSLRDIH